MKNIIINGREFNCEAIDSMNKTDFVKMFKERAEKKRADAGTWYDTITTHIKAEKARIKAESKGSSETVEEPKVEEAPAPE